MILPGIHGGFLYGVGISGLFGILGASCFYGSLEGSFVFDDTEALLNNNDVWLVTPASSVFLNDFWGSPITHNASHKSYRPLTVLSFRLQVWLNNGDLVPFSFHLWNLILHGVSCGLVYYVFKLLFNAKDPWERKSLIATLLFTIHPIHSEAVAGIVGRADLLCAILCFLSLLSYSYGAKRHHLCSSILTVFLSSILCGLAMLSKEQGVSIIGVCCAYDLLVVLQAHPLSFKNLFIISSNGTNKGALENEQQKQCPSTKHFLLRSLLLTLCGLVLIYFRYWIMGFQPPTFQVFDNPASFAPWVWTRIINYNYIYVLNFWLLLCPDWLCFDWSMGCVKLISLDVFPPDSRVLLIIVFWSFFICLVVRALQDNSSHSREILMALSFLVIPFLIASNIFVRVGFVIAERVLYLPSVGFCMLIAIGMEVLFTHIRPKYVYAFLTILVCSHVVKCYLRSYEWTSEAKLFMSGLKVCPFNAKVHYNLAKSSSNTSLAIEHYREALRLHPEYEHAMNNLANILRDQGNKSEAEKLLRKAISVRHNFPAAWMNLGIVLAHMEKFDEALEAYKTALTYRRKYPHCYYNLGNLYLSQKKYDLAYSAWTQATLHDPKHHTAWNNMIVMLDSIGELDKAESVGLEGLKHLPNDSALHFNIANTLGKKGRYKEAEEHFLKAIQLKPGQALYHTNLGVLYHRWKKLSLAEKEYLKAISLNQKLQNVKKNLEVVQNLKAKLMAEIP